MGLSWTHTAIGWTELSSEWPGRWETTLDTNELNRSQLNGMLETISAGLGWKEPGGVLNLTRLSRDGQFRLISTHFRSSAFSFLKR